MKDDKNALYNNKILQCLISGEIYTMLQLADNVGLSEKTVRTRIRQLDEWLEAEKIGKIEKRQGKGIWLEIGDRQKKILEGRLEQREDPAGDLDNRNKQLMGKLLKMKPKDVATLQQLADSLYLSPPTVSNLLKNISGWFEERNIRIKAVRNKGICLEGKEYSFRIAIKDYMLEMLPEVMEALFGTYAPGVNAARIRRIIVEAENAWRIELADNSFKMVWIMTCLSVARKSLAHELLSGNMQEEDIQRYNEYSFAESIYQRIGREYQVDLSEDDTILLAMLLLSAKKLKSFTDINHEDYAMQYDRNLKDFVKLVIETIDSVLDTDLAEDRLLYEGLLIHMRSAIFRMKYSTVTGDSISKYVKSEYKQTFLAAWSTSSLFEEYYDVQVTEDELAGIALYIQAAMIRRKKGKPLTALLISQRGMAACQLSVEMIKYSIPEITDIQVVSRHDFKLSLYPETDIIINGSGLDLEDARMVTVEDRISEKEIETIRRKAVQVSRLRNRPDFRFSSLCHQLFEVDLILVRPQVRDKDQLITMMVKRLEEKGDVTPNYLKSVFDRERATTTSIGRGIAIPHGNMMMEVNESRIVVAILDKPVKWHEDMVDTVFLLAVKMTSKFEIKRTKQFYKDFLLLTEDDDNMEAMKHMESALEVYQYFIK